MKLLDLYARLKKDISEVEDELETTIRTDHELLNETSLHLLKAGGSAYVPCLFCCPANSAATI